MSQVQRFGKYEVIRKLSRSMTDVYLARDTETNRHVVLKLIERLNDDFTQLVIEAEKRGALLQKQLHEIDPRILEIYEFGEQNKCFFVAMEYFEGKTLAEILRTERRIEPQRAARYAAEICSQLRTLHAFVSDVDGWKTAVVHGDVKPSNVQIGAGDELRLLDFGIAKVITSTHNLTHHNLGSPSYCSPERISKSQVDQHSDLWAVGVSLYEMVGGAPPYQAQDTRRLEQLIQSRRPPRALPQHCPEPLKAIVAKTLAGESARRYQSAQALEEDLRCFLHAQPTAAEREPPLNQDANVTIDKHPERPTVASKPPLSVKRPAVRIQKGWNDLSNVAIALLAGVLAGLLIFIPIGYYYRFSVAASKLRSPKDYAHEDLQSIAADWTLYNDLKTRNRFLGAFSPVSSLDAPLRAHLMAAAGDILENYRHSVEEQLSDFDWAKARLLLRHAVEIDASDSTAKGELALCNGYFDLAQKPPRVMQGLDNFRQARSYLPRWPDPHLGLARAYVYDFHNVARAVAEFQQAEKLGYKLGPREIEQEADGYLYRAETSLKRAKQTPATATQQRAKWLKMSHDDMERARNLYEPILGFSNVNTNFEQLHQDRDEQDKLQMENVKLVPAKTRVTKRYAGIRRWQ